MIKLNNSKIKDIKGIYKNCVYLRLVLKGNKLNIISLNYQYIKSVIDVENKDNINFDVYVSSKIFFNHIEKNGAVLIYKSDKLYIENKNTNIEIALQNDKQYNFIDISKENYIKYNKKDFFDLLNKSIKQIDKIPLYKQLGYIYMSYENKQMVATNGRCMSVYSIDFEGTIKEDIYLYREVIERLLKNKTKIKDDDVIYIYKDNDYILIIDNNIFITSNINLGTYHKYPNYKRVIPTEYNINISLTYNEITQLKDILKEAKKDIERSKKCIFSIYNNKLFINTKKYGSEFESNIELKHKIDKEFYIAFNIEYLINIFSYCKDDIQIFINFDSKPLKFVLNEDQFIILMSMSID